MNRAHISAVRQKRRLLAAWPPRASGSEDESAAELPAVGSEQSPRHSAQQPGAREQERRRLHRSLFEAEQVQRKLCAPREVRRGKFEIASEIFPVRYISGDFYDVLDLGAFTGLVVGDIAGKDLAAGLWFTHLMGLIRIHASPGSEPAVAVAAINRDLFRVQPIPHTASLFLGWLDRQRGDLVYCSAGHPPAFLLRRNDAEKPLREGGPLLGALPQATFESGRVVLEAGDALIVYSDGIVECRSCGGEEFGVERLLAAAGSAKNSSASAMLFTVLGAVQDFAGNCPREDDFALMVVRHLQEQH